MFSGMTPEEPEQMPGWFMRPMGGWIFFQFEVFSGQRHLPGASEDPAIVGGIFGLLGLVAGTMRRMVLVHVLLTHDA